MSHTRTCCVVLHVMTLARVDSSNSNPDGSLTTAAASARMLGLSLRRLQLDSGNVSYVDVGEGRPIVLLHGAPFTALGFFRVIRGLRPYYRVIAPDLPGFGASTASPSFPGTLQSYATFVEEFCRTLGLNGTILYVNDASGCFGLAAAARLEPELAGLVVASTIQIPLSGCAWIVKQVLRHVVNSRLMRALNRRYNLFPWLVATVAPWLRPLTSIERTVLTSQFETPEKRDRVLDLFGQLGSDDEFMRAAASAAQRLAHKPTLILYGQFDPARLIGGQRFYRRLFVNSSVRVITMEEHFPILSSGDEVARAIHAWISNNTRPP